MENGEDSVKEVRLCVRCNKPVILEYDRYYTFDFMHWLCFHLEHEHETDPDVACDDPDCPWWRLEVYIDALKEHGIDPNDVYKKALSKRYGPYD